MLYKSFFMQTETLTKDSIFNLSKTLKVIENNSFLDEIFRDGDSKISYSLLQTMAKQNTISEDLVVRTKEIFEKIIFSKSKLYQEYMNLGDDSETEEPIRNNTNKKQSRYYGKRKILKDAEANGGKLSELDKAMLAINTLRNITSKLRNRGKKDKLNGTNILSDMDCRDIVAAVRIVENKIANIIKKK